MQNSRSTPWRKTSPPPAVRKRFSRTSLTKRMQGVVLVFFFPLYSCFVPPYFCFFLPSFLLFLSLCHSNVLFLRVFFWAEWRKRRWRFPATNEKLNLYLTTTGLLHTVFLYLFLLCVCVCVFFFDVLWFCFDSCCCAILMIVLIITQHKPYTITQTLEASNEQRQEQV